MEGFYIYIEDNKIDGCGVGARNCGSENVIDYEVSQEVFNSFREDKDRYIWNGTDIVENPDYEEIKRQKEQAIIMEMKMTPLDFLKAIEQYGITYDMVKQFMEENPLIERELRFCQFVYRKHPMLNSLEPYGITSEILDHIFKVANGEEE